jgi:hypothetical protein
MVVRFSLDESQRSQGVQRHAVSDLHIISKMQIDMQLSHVRPWIGMNGTAALCTCPCFGIVWLAAYHEAWS